MDTRKRVEGLQEYIKQGKIIEAMHEFYDANCKMQENANPACTGLAANVEREKQFVAQVKTWKGYTVKALAVEGNVSFVEATIDFTNQQDKPVHIEQVAVQRWNPQGKISHERFYYDSAAK